ncbi:MAG: phosphoribosyltransferase [Cellulomonas sp.]
MATTETAPGQTLPQEREVLDWELFGTAARELAQTVVDDGFVPDVVIAVARGGLPPGGAIAYALGTKAVGTLNVEFYTGVDQRLPDPVVLPPLLDTDAMHGLRALVVDDVADTGETLALVQRLMTQHCAEARTAVLYAKSRSIIEPDYVWRRTDRWITFPWSALPPVTPAGS